MSNKADQLALNKVNKISAIAKYDQEDRAQQMEDFIMASGLMQSFSEFLENKAKEDGFFYINAVN